MMLFKKPQPAKEKEQPAPEKLRYMRYYEHDGALRAYANRAMMLAFLCIPTTLVAVGLAAYVRLQPPTVIRVDQNGEAAVLGQKPAANSLVNVVQRRYMRNATALKLPQGSTDPADFDDTRAGSDFGTAVEPVAHGSAQTQVAEIGGFKSRQLISTKELSRRWDVPESTLRYWRCAGIGPTYVKLGGRIKYDLVDVDRYIRANKRMPSVRAHGG